MDKDGRRKIMGKARKKYKIDMFLFIGMISWKENFPFHSFLSFIIFISNFLNGEEKLKIFQFNT